MQLKLGVGWVSFGFFTQLCDAAVVFVVVDVVVDAAVVFAAVDVVVDADVFIDV